MTRAGDRRAGELGDATAAHARAANPRAPFLPTLLPTPKLRRTLLQEAIDPLLPILRIPRNPQTPRLPLDLHVKARRLVIHQTLRQLNRQRRTARDLLRQRDRLVNQRLRIQRPIRQAVPLRIRRAQRLARD